VTGLVNGKEKCTHKWRTTFISTAVLLANFSSVCFLHCSAKRTHDKYGFYRPDALAVTISKTSKHWGTFQSSDPNKWPGLVFAWSISRLIGLYLSGQCKKPDDETCAVYSYHTRTTMHVKSSEHCSSESQLTYCGGIRCWKWLFITWQLTAILSAYTNILCYQLMSPKTRLIMTRVGTAVTTWVNHWAQSFIYIQNTDSHTNCKNMILLVTELTKLQPERMQSNITMCLSKARINLEGCSLLWTSALRPYSGPVHLPRERRIGRCVEMVG